MRNILPVRDPSIGCGENVVRIAFGVFDLEGELAARIRGISDDFHRLPTVLNKTDLAARLRPIERLVDHASADCFRI